MALIFKTNGAPLSGALFVSNPKRPQRQNGLALTRNSAMTALHKMRAARNPLLFNYHGNGAKRAARNPLLLNYHGNGLALRTNTRKLMVKRNSYGAFANKLTAPVADVVGKAPMIGGTVKQYVAPLLMGVLVGGVHYGAMFGLGKIPMVSDAVAKVSGIKYTLTGVAAATALRFLPVGQKEIRDQIAVGALLAGSAIDMYRFLTAKVSDLGDIDEDGFIESGALDDDGYIETGDGGMYDVLPFDSGAADMGYSGASLADAYYAPHDLSVVEGEAALSGHATWIQTFGDPPVQAINRGGPSGLAGQPGHRFGWLIRLVGFDRFQRIAALNPEQRVNLIAQLKQQAVQAVDAVSPASAQETAGVALDMNGVALDMNGVALDMNGLGINTEGLGAVMHAGSAF